MLKTIFWALLAALNISLILFGIRNIFNGADEGNALLVIFGLIEIAVGSWKFTQPFKEAFKN